MRSYLGGHDTLRDPNKIRKIAIFFKCGLVALLLPSSAIRQVSSNAPRMRIDVVFTDEQGRRWRVYDWSVISGHKYRRSPGEQCAEYRGFLNEQTAERRVYRFATEAASRLCSTHLLRQQLAAAQLVATRKRTGRGAE